MKTEMKNEKTHSKSLTALRIISGKWKRSKIDFIVREGLRPTGDRLRVTLFNWLAHDIRGAFVLDLFAGSGILGMECLSREAKEVVFVEKDPLVVKRIQNHLTRLKAEDYQLLSADVFHLLKSPPTAWLEKVNLVFLDPPFHQGWITEVCTLLESSQILAPNALIYIKIEITHCFFEQPKHWLILKELKTEQTQCFLYRRQSP